MRKLLLCVVAVLACVSSADRASPWAMTQPYGTGRIYPIWRTGAMPKDILNLMNFPGRVYGGNGFFGDYGQFENLYFQGDAQTFNRFLVQYARLKMKPLFVTIRVGQPVVRGMFGAKVEKEIRYDWQYTRWIPNKPEQPETVSVDLWIGGSIRLDEIRVPQNVELRSGGEIEKFIAEHEAKRRTD